MRMPAADWKRLTKMVKPRIEMTDASLLLRKLRLLKSNAEINEIRESCRIQSEAMNNIQNVVRVGMTEKEIARIARIELLKNGADRVDYIACASGPGGYTDIVSAASTRRLQEGDVLIIDAGTIVNDYFCDFNRNWYVGWEIPSSIREMEEALHSAIDAGMRAAVPGRNTADVWHAMAAKMPISTGDSLGRMGHSVGLAITEWPSIQSKAANANVTLEEGMVFAIEPALGYGDIGQFLVHEEDIVVRNGGAQLLSPRAARSMSLITKGLASVDV